MNAFFRLVFFIALAIGMTACKAQGPTAESKIRTFSEQAKRYTPGGRVLGVSATSCRGVLPMDGGGGEFAFALAGGPNPDYTPGAAGGEQIEGMDLIVRRAPAEGDFKVVSVGKLLKNKKASLVITAKYKGDETVALSKSRMILRDLEDHYIIPGPALGD